MKGWLGDILSFFGLVGSVVVMLAALIFVFIARAYLGEWLQHDPALRNAIALCGLIIMTVVAGYFGWRVMGWVKARRVRERRRRNQCTQCGYDLQSSPDRCPECGAARARSRDPKPPQRSLLEDFVE